MFPLERITQNVVKSHIETSQYSTEELKRFAWTLYTPEEMRVFQNKVPQGVTVCTIYLCYDPSNCPTLNSILMNNTEYLIFKGLIKNRLKSTSSAHHNCE